MLVETLQFPMNVVVYLSVSASGSDSRDPLRPGEVGRFHSGWVMQVLMHKFHIHGMPVIVI